MVVDHDPEEVALDAGAVQHVAMVRYGLRHQYRIPCYLGPQCQEWLLWKGASFESQGHVSSLVSYFDRRNESTKTQNRR